MQKFAFVFSPNFFLKPVLLVGLICGLYFFTAVETYAVLPGTPTINGVLGCPLQGADCRVNQILPGGKLQVKVSGVSMQALQNANAQITLNGVSYTTDFDASLGSLTANIPTDITPGNYALTVVSRYETATWPTVLPTGEQVATGAEAINQNNQSQSAAGAQCGGGVLGGLGCIKAQFDPKGSVAGAQNIGDFIIAIINVLLGLLLAISVLFIIIGGYQYVTSAGKEDQAKTGRRTVTYAVMGVAVAILSYMIVRVVDGTLNK